MQNTKAIEWEKLTWEEIQSLSTDLAILPIGATEQHGPHLGVGMDFHNASTLCKAVSAQTQTPTLPCIPYGCSMAHSHTWPGTLSLQPETVINLVCNIFDWLYPANFKRLLIINAHVSNFAPLRCALEKIRYKYEDASIAIINVGEISERVNAAFTRDASDWHANDAETSLMMATAPDLVRPDKLPDSNDDDRTRGMVFAYRVNQTSRNGTTGTPSNATKAKGEKLFAWMVEDLSKIIEKAKTELPPLA